MSFPQSRPRRLRETSALRNLVRETTLTARHLVYPLFFREGIDVPVPLEALPGLHHFPVAHAAQVAEEVYARGIHAVLLFGIPLRKDPEAQGAWDPNGPVPLAVTAIKAAIPEMLVMTDVCLDAYTDHGHCGIVRPSKRGGSVVDNDSTLQVLAKIALAHARAGADIVAPSDMMDGRVQAIRQALDAEGWTHTGLLSYAVKYASALYGPFREAARCTPQFGDRTTYQMDPGNVREALREAALDEAEGADMLMVKPALFYLDVIRAVRAQSHLPLAAYSVSGEYAMLHAAASAGMIDLDRAILEALTSIRRAGADIVITYHALRAAELLASHR